MLKETKVLCINTFFPVKDSKKKIHGFERPLCYIFIHFKLSFGHRPLKTVFQFPSAYVNKLFWIFLGIFANTQDLLVMTFVFLVFLTASHRLMVETVLAKPFSTSEHSTKVAIF